MGLPLTARGVRTAALAVAGGVGASLLGLPLPFLLGPLALAVAAGVAGHPVANLPGWGLTVIRVVVGILIGSSIDPGTLGRIGEFAAGVAIVPLQAALVTAAGSLFLRRVNRASWSESLLGALPGGLFTLVPILQESGLKAHRVGLVHTIRVALAAAAVPFVLAWGLPRGEFDSRATGFSDMAPEQILWFAALAACGLAAARLLRFPGSEVMLPMALAALARFSGAGSTVPPSELVILSQLVLGTAIGAGFRGVPGGEMRRWVLSGVGVAAIGMAVMVLVAWALHALAGLPLHAGLLGFAPGGVAEMSVAALALGVDPGFVAAMHVWRLVLVVAFIPVLLRLLRRIEPERQPES